MLNSFKIKKEKGFSLVETLVATAIFVFISVAIYSGFANILKIMTIVRVKGIMANLSNEQFEIARNLPYASVGTVSGIPSGVLPQDQTIVRDGKSFDVQTVVRNFDDPFDGTFNGIPKDTSPADMKIDEVTISCTSCDDTIGDTSFTSKIAPKNLETASTDGALVVKVYDASGLPVSDANVNIVNNSISPTVNLNDTTDINGTLTLVDAPPSVGGYQIIVTKDGYSTDRTYATGGTGNPAHPTKPNATVVVQQVTQVSFTIDQTSTIDISAVNSQCVATPSFDFTVTGTKLIGTNPNTIKYSNNFATDSNGNVTLSNMEWDTYNITGIDTVYDIIGTNPLLSLGVNPNVDQDMQIITAPQNGRRLVVVVRDQSTGLPVADATVAVTGPSSYSKSYITSQGFITQTDWSGGSGQSDLTNFTKYFDSDGNVDYYTSAGNLTLVKALGKYVTSGYLTSSAFDTGSSSNFKQIVWNPATQPSQAGTSSVRVQIATNNDDLTWNYKGPDGTSSTYYTPSNQNLESSHNGDRYLRYRLYLSTANQSYTPTIADISFTYSSDCIPPGQVSFSALASGTYTITVTKSGYQGTTKSVTIASGTNWTKQEITISQ